MTLSAQVDVILPPAEVYAQVFRGVWLSTEGFGGKQKLLQAVKGRDLYKNGNNKHAKAVLLAVEHQLATGDRLTAGAGGYSRRWEGTLSVEHIMPQVCCCVTALPAVSALKSLEGLNMAPNVVSLRGSMCLGSGQDVVSCNNSLQV